MCFLKKIFDTSVFVLIMVWLYSRVCYCGFPVRCRLVQDGMYFAGCYILGFDS